MNKTRMWLEEGEDESDLKKEINITIRTETTEIELKCLEDDFNYIADVLENENVVSVTKNE